MLKIIIFLSIIGFCPCLSFSSQCGCELMFLSDPNPVCGANGQTYKNKCEANCNRVVSNQRSVARFARSNMKVFSKLPVQAPVLASATSHRTPFVPMGSYVPVPKIRYVEEMGKIITTLVMRGASTR